VLTDAVKVMEVPEEGADIASAVWLERFDRFLISSRKPLYFFSSAAIKIGGRGEPDEVTRELTARRIGSLEAAKAVAQNRFRWDRDSR